MMNIVLAIVIGGLFGFVLHRVGAANPQNLINMLSLQDLHLAKVILLAVGSSSLVLFMFLGTGVIEASHISIKSAYTGVLIGGAIFGIGFALAGYCPGTCLVGVGDGRKDAAIFIFGCLIGAFIYTLMYGWLYKTFPSIYAEIAGGKVTLAETGSQEVNSLFGGIPSLAVAGTLAVVLILLAWKLPKRINVPGFFSK